MDLEEKVSWLERALSDSIVIRARAFRKELPDPPFETGAELKQAIWRLFCRKAQQGGAPKATPRSRTGGHHGKHNSIRTP